MAMNTLFVHDETSLKNCPTCDLIVFRHNPDTSEEYSELYEGGTKMLLCQSQISWDAIAGLISTKTGSKIINCFQMDLSTATFDDNMLNNYYMHTGDNDIDKGLLKGLWYAVESDGATTPTYTLKRISSAVDNTTIEVNADNNLQIKEKSIEYKHLVEDLISTLIADKDTASDEKLASEKAVRTELDKKVDLTRKVGSNTLENDITEQQLDDDIKEITNTYKNKTISADDNTISELETDNFKDGVLEKSSDTITNDDTKIPSSGLVKKITDDLKENLATYRGSFATKADLDAYTGDTDNNDYAVVLADEEHDNECSRYIYVKDTTSWTYQYKVNNKPFTQAQQDAIDSTATTTKIEQIETNKTGIETLNKRKVGSNTLENDITAQNIDDDIKEVENEYKNKTIDADNNTLKNIDKGNLKTQETTEKGKAWIVGDDGTFNLGWARNYKTVTTFTGETGDSETLYYLSQIDGTNRPGLYRYDGTNYAKVGGGDLFEDVTEYPTTDIDPQKLYRRPNLENHYRVADTYTSTHEITANGLQEVGGGPVTATFKQLTDSWDTYSSYFTQDDAGTLTRFYDSDFVNITACLTSDYTFKYIVKYYKDGWWNVGSGDGGATYTAGTNITISSDNVISSMPVLLVDALPTTGQDQTIIYKVKTENSLNWWNGTDWTAFTDTSGMTSVTSLPTSGIKESTLYRLTQNMTHQSDEKYRLTTKAFVESTTTQEGTITHNTTTDKWYNGADEISVANVSTFPDPNASTVNNYYYDGTLLKLGEAYKETIVDYYAGIYAIIEGTWQCLASSNFSVDYSTSVVKNKPKIGGVEVNGDHEISYYGGITESVADAKYQPKEMEKPLSGFTATTVEGTLEEINTKYGTAVRIMGQKNFESDLPTDPSVGDLWCIKYKWDTDYTSNYGHQRQLYYESDTPTKGKITHNVDLDVWYNGLTEITVNNVTTLPTASASTVGTYYYCNEVLYLDSVGKYVESYLNKCWNGVKWFDYGPGNVDLTKYERRDDVTDKVKVANAGIVFLDTSLVVKDSTLTMGYVDCQPSTPITDIQSADRELMVIPDDIGAKGLVHQVQIQTVAGNFTALENVASLPTSYKYTDKIWAASATKAVKQYKGETETYKSVTDSTKTGEGYEHCTDTDVWYKDGSVITITGTTTPTEWNESTVGLYYYVDSKLYLGIVKYGAYQAYDQQTGELLVDTAGLPNIFDYQEQISVAGGSATTFYIIKTDSTYGISIIGYQDVSMETYAGETITVHQPLIELEAVTVNGDSTYMKNCQIADTGLHIDADGNYGDWVITESTDSVKYSSHDETYGLRHGFAGTCVFTKRTNTANWQWINAYVSSNTIYIQGDVTVGKFRINCIW